MLQLLQPHQYHLAAPLFRPIDYHLCLATVLDGSTPGKVWVDDPANPRSALAAFRHRFYLAGDENNPPFLSSLRDLFLDEIIPNGRREGLVEVVISYSTDGWGEIAAELLADKYPIHNQRKYLHSRSAPRPGWRDTIPDGFRVQRVDATLLEETHLEHIDEVRDEVCSETPTIDFFMANRFGFCLRSTDKIVGWCMSEYNTPFKVEIGIATVPEFRRRGVARITASALMEHAYANGIQEIGWECWASNTASIQTALRLGLVLQHNYPVLTFWLDECANLVVNGNIRFYAGKYQEAGVWFERALASANPPLWGFAYAAFNYTHLGEYQTALTCLETAMDKGYQDWDWVTSSEHLEPLHDSPAWQLFLARIVQRGS